MPEQQSKQPHRVLHHTAGRWHQGQTFAADQVDPAVLTRWVKDKVVEPVTDPAKPDKPAPDTVTVGGLSPSAEVGPNSGDPVATRAAVEVAAKPDPSPAGAANVVQPAAKGA